MPAFGDYLLEHGVLTAEQHREVMQSMQVYGGRLGTNLVELGYLRLDELAAHLSDFLSVPLPPVDWIEAPDPKAIKLLPMTLIRRYKILPIHLDGGRIHVAMLDPQDEQQLDFIRTASDREPVPYVLPEVRLLYWLETHLGVDRHPRFVNLATRSRTTGEFGMRNLDRDHAEREPGAEAGLVAAESLEAAPAPEPVAEEAWEDAEDELLLEELVEPAAPAEPEPEQQAPEPAPPVQEVSRYASQLEAELAGAADRNGIARCALQLARCYSSAAALFVVNNNLVSGFMADGGGIGRNVEGIVIPQDTPSLFAQPALSKFPFRGQPPPDGIDGRLMRALGRPECHEVLVHPVMLRGRVVNLLYADNGPDALAESSVAALSAVADCVARAYERLILEKKERR